MTAPHDAYQALRIVGFRRYLAGNVLGTIGHQMQSVAIGWELYERTRSPLALGLVGLVQVVPLLLLFLPVGHLVDRYDRRRVLIGAEAGLALTAFGLAAVSALHGPIPLVYLLLTVNGAARAFQGPAKSALLPEIVPVRVFQNAVTWNSGGWQVADVVGPALGGVLIAASGGASAVYVANGVAALLFLLLLRRVPTDAAPRRVPVASLSALLEGVRYVRKSEVLFGAITLDLFAVLFGGAVALLPVFAKDILHVGPAGLGWLLAAQSIGAVLMALALAHRPPLRRAGPVLLWSVAAFGAATIVFGLSRSFVLSFAALAAAGAADSISVVIRATLAQLGTPVELRGRVSAINSLFIGMSNELGGFESGAVAALAGPVFAVVSGGVGTIAVVGIVAARWKPLATLGRMEGLAGNGERGTGNGETVGV
ncbi:MAG: MFS transporter [Gemmatimonadales bacterium]